MFRAILLPARNGVAPALLVVDTDSCDTLGPPALYLPVVEADLEEVLACHGWARQGPWWLARSGAFCEVTPTDASDRGASTDV